MLSQPGAPELHAGDIGDVPATLYGCEFQLVLGTLCVGAESLRIRFLHGCSPFRPGQKRPRGEQSALVSEGVTVGDLCLVMLFFCKMAEKR